MFGRYQLIKLLGQGNMGSVYLAEDTTLKRLVAVKIPKFSAETDPVLQERFYREARAAAVLNHANICPVFDVGEINGQQYITMAYVKGRPLSDFVDPDNPAPADQAATLQQPVVVTEQDIVSPQPQPSSPDQQVIASELQMVAPQILFQDGPQRAQQGRGQRHPDRPHDRDGRGGPRRAPPPKHKGRGKRGPGRHGHKGPGHRRGLGRGPGGDRR